MRMKQHLMDSAFVICVIFLGIFINGIRADEAYPLHSDIEEYDEKLSGFLKEILENFREQMPEGIDAIGVPPVDPLVIPNVDQSYDDDIANIELHMRDLNVTGISRFQIEDLRADLERGFAKFSISLPEMNVRGHCDLEGKVLNVLPVDSKGPFSVTVYDVRIAGTGDLNVTTHGKTRIHMNDLKLKLTFESLAIEFKNLLGGGRWTQMLIKIMTGIGPKLFKLFHEEAMEKLNSALLTLINNELDKGTLSDLIDQIPMR